MNLSKNFTLEKLTSSPTAKVKGIDNTPNAAEIANLKLLAEKILQPLFNYFGDRVILNSCFRSQDLNTAIKGSKNSHHCSGQAVDLEVIGVSNFELANWISRNLKFTQLILEFHTIGVSASGWVHVSYVAGNVRNEILTAKLKAGKTVYLKGLNV